MKPLFPSYVFVRLNSAQEFFLVKDLDGVRNYVRFGKEIAKVSESVIDQLKSISGQHSGIEVSSDVFMHGEFLHIYNGPLTGLLCEVVEYQGKKKVLVRVNLLNRTVVVDLPINSFSIMA